jgi:hypothetical protein
MTTSESSSGPNPTTSIYNATGSLARFEKKIFFEKRSSLLQRWRCSCKFKSCRIGSRVAVLITRTAKIFAILLIRWGSS